jgi:hypothetical protein
LKINYALIVILNRQHQTQTSDPSVTQHAHLQTGCHLHRRLAALAALHVSLATGLLPTTASHALTPSTSISERMERPALKPVVTVLCMIGIYRVTNAMMEISRMAMAAQLNAR